MITIFRHYLGSWRYFALSPFLMRAGPIDHWRASGSEANPQPVHWMGCDYFGANLSSALFHLKNVDEKRYRRLLEHVRIVEPSFEATNFVIPPGRSPIPFVVLKDQPEASWEGLSDGTLRALGLALIIETAAAASSIPNQPASSLSIIEEPENGIFPGLLRQFLDLFEEWAPTAQFIFTSHSPYVIDAFDDKRECVTIFTKATDRSVTLQPPKATPDNAEDRLSLSEEYASQLFQ